MTPRKKLRYLRTTALKALRRLRGDNPALAAGAASRARERALSVVTIELLNTWGNFARAYYLSCLVGTRNKRGRRVAATRPISSLNDGIGIAVRRFNRRATPRPNGVWHRWQEPTWHEPATLLKLAEALGFSNLHDVRAAFSLGSRVFRDLPVFRNYFAHRSEGTFKAALRIGARQYRILGKRKPSEVLQARPSGRPQPLIAEWFLEVEEAIRKLCR